MPERPISYRLNPLPQSQRPTQPVAPAIPENLYKPSQTKAKQFKPSRSAAQPEPAPKPTPSNPVTPSRPAPDPARFQQSQPQTIARYLLEDSDLACLDQFLRAQESKRYQLWQTPSPSLEQLAIVRRPDQRYQIVLGFNHQAISSQVFRTMKHCTEAAAELEQKFELSIATDGATAEAMEGIVRAAVMRESVELACVVV